MAITIHALAESHITAILTACSDWEELARFGPPYWRPRSSAELRTLLVDLYVALRVGSAPEKRAERPPSPPEESSPERKVLEWLSPSTPLLNPTLLPS